MKKFLVNYLSDVAYAMYDSITDDKLRDVMFVGHYEDIIMILKELLIFDETVPHHIRMISEELDGYDKEYCIILDDEMNYKRLNNELKCLNVFYEVVYMILSIMRRI